jgi:hypothetical protein
MSTRPSGPAGKRPEVSKVSQDVATLRPGQEQHAPRSAFQTAEAETVLFASARALPVADDALIARPTQQEAARFQIHPRRKWLSRAVLLLILVMQALLTLRMNNTAFEDEALYLYVGHLEIAHWLHGAALQGDYPSYFSGAPVLYPVLGAAADSVGGLAAARAVSLLAMLAATSLVYAMSRRLFSERVALCAALIFAVAEPTLFLSDLATYDATALCLLALAAWLVVRTAEFRWPAYLLAAPIAVLAVATKYASLLWVPGIIALAGLAAWPRSGRKALIAPITLAVTIAVLLYGTVYLAGPDYWRGITSTTLARAQSTDPTSTLLWDCVQWIGLPVALAMVGTVAYAMRPATETASHIASAGSKSRRVLLGMVMTGSALLAPADQIHIHTAVSLHKHVGFGLVFAAPIAGVGLARIIGDHFRRAQIGIAIWCGALALGMTQANDLFHDWPDSSVFIKDMARYLRPGARYLSETDEVPIYYLRNYPDAQPDQFTSTYYFQYVDKQGKFLTGDAAFVAAIQAGYFQMVAFDNGATAATDAVIAHALATSPDYRLADVIPNNNNSGNQYIWVKSG